MPAIVGAVKVNSISTSSVLHIGDCYYIQPMSTSKSFAGGGSFNIGNGTTVNIGYSNPIVYDQDVFDSVIAKS